MCGEKTPGLSSYPIVPPHSLPRRSHFASLNQLVGCSSSTVASVSAAPVEVGRDNTMRLSQVTRDMRLE